MCFVQKPSPCLALLSLCWVGRWLMVSKTVISTDEVVLCAPTRRVTPHPSPAGPLCDSLLTNQLGLCSFDVVMKSLYS